MATLSTRLPSKFTHVVHPALTPSDLYTYLSELFAEQISLQSDNDFLSYHGTPGSVYHRIQTFDWYIQSVAEKGRVLDWGCNHATDSCLLRKFRGDSLELFGCDWIEGTEFPVFHNAAQLTYSKLDDHITLPYENNFFDTVIASGALEHAASDYASLQELYRILKPEGTLIITYLPNAYSLLEWRYEHLCKDGFHMRRYTMRDAKNLLKHNGFFPVKWGYQSFFWESRCARLGLKNNRVIPSILHALFPIHILSGCMQFVAVKKLSM